jgi:hypothetical protein
VTSEMAFECVLVCNDPSVFGAIARTLKGLSISIEICLRSSKALDLMKKGSTDLLVLDWDGESSAELLENVWKERSQKKPVIVAVADQGSRIPGAHLVIEKPLTAERTTRSFGEAYSRLLLEYRRHVRHALMVPVVATNQNGEELQITVADIGDAGVGLCTKTPVHVGDTLQFCLSLPNTPRDIFVQARVLWTREYGRAGCEFVRIPPVDVLVLHDWLRSKCHVKPPQNSETPVLA